MAIIEGTAGLKEARAVYDFAVDGGATGDITLRGDGPLGNTIPAASVIVGGYLEVTTAFTSSGSATVALTAESSGDILAATGVASLTVGMLDIVPDSTGSTAVETTAERNLVATIATAALTAGACTLVVFYR